MRARSRLQLICNPFQRRRHFLSQPVGNPDHFPIPFAATSIPFLSIPLAPVLRLEFAALFPLPSLAALP
jgi:hypothetical protein